MTNSETAGGLSNRARNVAHAASEALFAEEDKEGKIQPGSREVCERAVRGLDRSVALASSDVRRAFGLLTILLEWLPLFVIGAPHRMSRLPIDARVRYLEALESHRIGLFAMLLVAFKVPLAIPAFEEGEELALTGFDREHTAARRKLPVAKPVEARLP